MLTTIVQGKVGKIIILKIKTKFLREKKFSKNSFLHGEKESFEEYSLIVEFAEFTFQFLLIIQHGNVEPAPGLRYY